MFTKRGNVANQEIEVGLTPDQEHEAWKRYEICGNMAQVARDMQLSYFKVRQALNRDQIRLYEISKARAEEAATIWEKREKRAAEMAGEIMDILDGVIKHIKACVTAGAPLTDLKTFRNEPMTPTQAFQWVLETKQLDLVGKIAFTAAKISAGLRQFAAPAPERGLSGDPTKLSNQDLARMVQELKEAGREVPFALQQWADTHARDVQAALPAVLPPG